MEQKIVSEKWLYNAISDYTNRHPISGKLVAKKFELMKQLTDERIEKVENSIKESEEKIEQILITGVLTHLCCETTARDAFMRNFEVFFLVDATASYNEDLHLGSLRAISHGFGICLSTEEIINEK